MSAFQVTETTTTFQSPTWASWWTRVLLTCVWPGLPADAVSVVVEVGRSTVVAAVEGGAAVSGVAAGVVVPEVTRLVAVVSTATSPVEVVLIAASPQAADARASAMRRRRVAIRARILTATPSRYYGLEEATTGVEPV